MHDTHRHQSDLFCCRCGLGEAYGEGVIEEVNGKNIQTVCKVFGTLDLDGIIWLITVKLLFWVLGFLLATLFGLLAIILGLALSVVVYPFALVKNIRNGEVK